MVSFLFNLVGNMKVILFAILATFLATSSLSAQLTPIERTSQIRTSDEFCDFSCREGDPPAVFSEETFETSGFEQFNEAIRFAGGSEEATQNSFFSSNSINVETFSSTPDFFTEGVESRSADSSFNVVFEVVNNSRFQLSGTLVESDFIEFAFGEEFGDRGVSAVSLEGVETDLLFESTIDGVTGGFDSITTPFDVSGLLEPGTYTLNVFSTSQGDIDPGATTSANVTLSVVAVPEPTHLAMLMGTATLLMLRRKKK